MPSLTPLKYAFVIFTFVAVIHHSVGRVYLGVAPLAREPTADTPLAAAYDRAIRAGHHLGLSTEWRMYTPVVREVAVAEAYALTPDGTWMPIPLPNLSADHRARRSIFDAWLFDFKAAIIHFNYFAAAHDPRATRVYMAWLARRVRRDHGFEPREVKVQVKRAEIPPPGDHAGWTPHEAAFEVAQEYTFP